MSSLSRPKPVGYVLIVSGALFVLTYVLPLVGIDVPLTLFAAYISLVVALVVLCVLARPVLAKVAFAIAAVGFGLVVVNVVFFGALADLLAAAIVVGAIAVVAGAVALLVGDRRRAAGIALVIAALLVGFYFVGAIGPLGSAASTVALLVGVALVLAGTLMIRRVSR